jgi:prevent-host-death family protein
MADVTVGLREFRAHLARYVKIVKEGGTVTLTEWGKPVARIVPLAEGEEKPPLEERIKALVRTGRYHWSGERLEPHHPTISLKDGTRSRTSS